MNDETTTEEVPHLKDVDWNHTTDVQSLARLLDVNKRQITDYVGDGTFERAGRGQYNVRDCVHSLLRSLRKRAQYGEGRTIESGDALKERELLVQAQRMEKQAKYQQLMGELIDRKEMEAFVLDFASALVSDLVGFPGRMSPTLVNEDVATIHERLDDEIRSIREALYQRVKDGLASPELGGGAQAPAQADAGSVGGSDEDIAA